MNPTNTLRKAPQREVLSQADVEKLLALKETQKALKERLEVMDQAIRESEESILAQITRGADATHCGYAVSVQTIERRYPAWKEHFIEKLGKSAADAVLIATEPTVYRRVVIK